MTQQQFDIIHTSLGYALKDNHITQYEYDLALAILCQEHPNLKL